MSHDVKYLILATPSLSVNVAGYSSNDMTSGPVAPQAAQSCAGLFFIVYSIQLQNNSLLKYQNM